MNRLLKSALRGTLPERFHPRALVHDLIMKTAGGQVISGPFLGMKWMYAHSGRPYYPYILGTHEKELSPVVNALCVKRFDIVVNIGAGHGYYAVGFARRQPHAQVIAFEAQPERMAFLQQIAEMNDVAERLRIHGLCDAPALSSALSSTGTCLVLMDIEGAERSLLDPSACPRLRECHVLVEVHDFADRKAGEIVSQRFRDSHRIREIWSTPRTIQDLPIRLAPLYSILLKEYFVLGMHEGRPERMRWFCLEPHPPPLA